MGEALPAVGDEHEPQRQPRHQQADVLYHLDERRHGTLLRRTTPYWLECRTGSATSCGCREGAYVLSGVDQYRVADGATGTGGVLAGPDLVGRVVEGAERPDRDAVRKAFDLPETLTPLT